MPEIFTNQDKPINKKIKATASYPPERVHMFSTFCVNPIGVSFIDQEPDEKILLFLRRHLITNVPWVIITIFLILIPIFLFIFNLGSFVFGVIEFPMRFIVIFLLFYYLIVFTYAFVNFITWFYNVLIVTQKRIVDIDFSDVVIHNIAFTKLSHVQEVNYTQAGFLRSFFNFGDVFIQTAGPEINLEGLSVPMPRKASYIIANLIGRRARVN